MKHDFCTDLTVQNQQIGHLMTTPYPAPEQRVRAYLDHMAVVDSRQVGWSYSNVIHEHNGIEITRTDVRDVLNELDEHRRLYDEAIALLSQIDGVLDTRDALGVNAGEAIAKLLGNRPKADPFAAKLASREDRMTMAAQIVLAMPGTVTETDRRNAAVRLAELVTDQTDENGE